MKIRTLAVPLVLAAALTPALASDAFLDDPFEEVLELLEREIEDPLDPERTGDLLQGVFIQSLGCLKGKVAPASERTTADQALTPMVEISECMLDTGEGILNAGKFEREGAEPLSRKDKRLLGKALRNLETLSGDMAAAAGSGGKDRAKWLRRAMNRAIRPIVRHAYDESYASVEQILYGSAARATQLETKAQLATANDLHGRYEAAFSEPPKDRKLKQALKRLARAVKLLGDCDAGIDALLPLPDVIEDVSAKHPDITREDSKRRSQAAKQFNRGWPKLMNKLFLAVRTLGQAAGPIEDALRNAEPPPSGLPAGFFASVQPGTYYVSYFPGDTLNPTGEGLNLLDEFTNWHFTHAGPLDVTTREQLWTDVQALVDGAEQGLEAAFGDLFFNVITNQGEGDWDLQMADFVDTVNASEPRTWAFTDGALFADGYTATASYRTSGGDTTAIHVYLYRAAPPLDPAFLALAPGRYSVEPMLRDFRLARDVVVAGSVVRNDDPDRFWAAVDAELEAQVGNLESLFAGALDDQAPIERTVLDELKAVTGGCGPDHLPMDFSPDGATYVFTRTVGCSPLDPQNLGALNATYFVRVTRIGD